MTQDQHIDWQTIRHSEISEDVKLRLIQTFAGVIAEQTSLNDLLWAVANEVNAVLGYLDCVFYLYDTENDFLVQKAAFGHKKVNQKHIIDPIEIDPGEGIVGGVYITGMVRLINDTTLDGNYIIDDRFRLSEVAVPIFNGGEVIGVIDSEHPTENYYTQNDADILVEIAALISARMDEI